MKKELEKLLARVNWQIESKERSLKQEKETLVHEAQNLNTNYVKQTCERIEQLEKELLIHETYKYTFINVNLKMYSFDHLRMYNFDHIDTCCSRW